MLRWRRLAGLMAVVAIGLGSASTSARAAGPAVAAQRSSVAHAAVLEIHYSSPLLVRAGERVRLPVDVVCATAGGEACPARASLAISEEGSWRTVGAQASPQLQFDLTGPAMRALGDSPDASMSFFLRAEADGVKASLPAAEAATPLQLYIVRDIPVVRVPPIAFGQASRGRTVLSLPWGSGPTKAGIRIGRESATVGPSSFDVDRLGRIHLLDPLQGRLAVFSGGRLQSQTALTVTSTSDVALTARGDSYAVDQAGSSLTARRIDPSGRSDQPMVLGPGILSEVRTDGERAYVEALPLDAWRAIEAPTSPTVIRSQIPGLTAARPLAGGSGLLRAGTESSVKLGTVSGGHVHDAVELRSRQRLGEVALAEPDGHGGYVAVLHVWREAPAPADRYQFVHVIGDRVVSSFALSDRRFAECSPLSKFRLGLDGKLYQLTSSPTGMRVVRYDLGGES